MAKTKTAVVVKQMFEVQVSPDCSKYMDEVTFDVEADTAEEAAQIGARLARTEYQSEMKRLANIPSGGGRIGQAEITVRMVGAKPYQSSSDERRTLADIPAVFHYNV